MPLNERRTRALNFITAKDFAMRGRFAAALGLTLGCLVLGCLSTAALASDCPDTLQQNKSQQNSADEAAVRGDLKAGSECADAADKALSEKKNEDAAERAKSKMVAPPAAPSK
jgi:hypothetical protein